MISQKAVGLQKTEDDDNDDDEYLAVGEPGAR